LYTLYLNQEWGHGINLIIISTVVVVTKNAYFCGQQQKR